MTDANAQTEIGTLLAGDEINTLEFYAFMTRLGYDKVLRDYALLGEIVYQIIQQYNGRGDALKDLHAQNKALADHVDSLQARVAAALAIPAREVEDELPNRYTWEFGFNTARDEFRARLTQGEA